MVTSSGAERELFFWRSLFCPTLSPYLDKPDYNHFDHIDIMMVIILWHLPLPLYYGRWGRRRGWNVSPASQRDDPASNFLHYNLVISDSTKMTLQVIFTYHYPHRWRVIRGIIIFIIILSYLILYKDDPEIHFHQSTQTASSSSLVETCESQPGTGHLRFSKGG